MKAVPNNIYFITVNQSSSFNDVSFVSFVELTAAGVELIILVNKLLYSFRNKRNCSVKIKQMNKI